MAEYIDKQYLGRKFQIDMMCLRGGTIFDTKRIIDSLPTADVIERSKIDKAIDELRKEIEENRLNVIDYADGEWIVKDFVYGAIDRLRENIGE